MDMMQTLTAKILSINIGLPGEVLIDGKGSMKSGIMKKPVTHKVRLDTLGFEGDGVQEKSIHGGPDKAVCVYCFEHYSYWEEELSRKLSPGAFGENLTVSGLAEDTVHIGDVFRTGEAEVQITQPRQPCHKLNKVFGLKEMACKVQTTGYSGFYLRVLKPGWVGPGDEMVRLKSGSFSVTAANQLMHGADRHDHQKIEEIVSLPYLSEAWRETFQKRLLKEDTGKRQKKLSGF